MTEMEQLKQNTEIERAKQQAEGVKAYLESLFEKYFETLRWRFRGETLDAITFMAYWAGSLIMLINDVPEDTYRQIMDLAFIPLAVSVMRTMFLFAISCRAQGELDGCINTLTKLGMMREIDRNDGNARRRKAQRKPLYERFKELFERTEKVGKEQYA